MNNVWCVHEGGSKLLFLLLFLKLSAPEGAQGALDYFVASSGRLVLEITMKHAFWEINQFLSFGASGVSGQHLDSRTFTQAFDEDTSQNIVIPFDHAQALSELTLAAFVKTS